MKRTVQVRVIPRAGRNAVKEFGDGFKAYLTAPALEGKANRALVEVLAEFFNLKKSQVTIVSGRKSRDKRVRLG